MIDLAFFAALSSTSVFAAIKASLRSIPFFMKARTTNPMMTTHMNIQSNKSTHLHPFYKLILSPGRLPKMDEKAAICLPTSKI